MVKLTLTSETYAPQKDAGGGRYYCRVLPQWNEDHTLVDVVEDIVDHKPTKADREVIISKWIESRKKYKIKQILEYDTSDVVNGFLLNGSHTWLDKDTRVGLVNSTTIEKNSGMTTTTLWFENHPYVVDVDKALNLLSRLEIYAKSCFNKTQEHIANVQALTTEQEIEGYDYTAGYPDQLEFTI